MNVGAGGGATNAGRGAAGTTTGNAGRTVGIAGMGGAAADMGGAATDMGGAAAAQRHGSPRWHPQVQYGWWHRGTSVNGTSRTACVRSSRSRRAEIVARCAASWA